MIFGRTTALEAEIWRTGFVRFAWFPTILDDGRVAWLEPVWRRGWWARALNGAEHWIESRAVTRDGLKSYPVRSRSAPPDQDTGARPGPGKSSKVTI